MQKGSSNVSINKIIDEDGDYPIYGAKGFIKNVSFYHQDKKYISIIKDGAGVGRIELREAFSSVIGTLQYLIPKTEIDIKYLYYFLSGINFKNYIRGAAIPHIYFKDYSNEEILIPPLEEQKQIVAKLDQCFEEIDKAKANAAKNLENATEIFQSKLNEIFSQKGEGWEVKDFEECIERISRSSKISKKKYLDEGKYPIISQEDSYINGYWDKSEDLLKVDRPLVIFGDHTKNLKYIDFDFVLGADGVKVLLPIKSINARFFYYQLKSITLDDLGYARHYKLLKQERIVIPPLEEQKQIVSKLDLLSQQIKKLESKYQQELNSLEELKKSILQKAFSGELVKN